MSESGKPSRGRRIALMLSLCLNVALIALIVVGLTRAGNSGFISQPGGPLAPGTIARGMPPEEQEKIRGVIAEHQGAMRQARKEARRARLEAFRTFAADDYNPTAFAKALEAVRVADSTLEEEAITRLRDTINTLSPDQRQTVIARVRSGANRPWWKRMFGPPAPQPPQK